MFTERHCITLLVLAGVGCAKAVSGDDLADELPGSAQSPAAGGSGPAAAGTGPTTAAGGTSASAAGGGFASGATGTTGGGAPSSVACASPRMPSMAGAMQGNSGSFETTDAVCYFVEGSFNNWACSNLGGRSVTVNGTSVTCGGALPAQADGGYYFEFSASTDGTDYTSFYWYTS